MPFEFYQIDSFTDKIFAGNPACVVPLKSWLPDELLLKIAGENAVAETAFFIIGEERIQLRWFTPEIEMDLCGHATLAAAHCLKTILNYEGDQMIFTTLSGDLPVFADGDTYKMDFPARKPVSAVLPELIAAALNIPPQQILKSRDYVLVYDSETEVRNIQIDRFLFDQINLDPGGLIVTAPGNQADFVSRYFTPQASIFEDPVTGSAHCSLIPYWAERLSKTELSALQLSKRTGALYCCYNGDRVIIGGKAKTYSRGCFYIE